MGRVKVIEKKKERSVFKKPPIPMGKHYTEEHVESVKRLMGLHGYTNLDIALECGMRPNQVEYIIRKIKKERQSVNNGQ